MNLNALLRQMWPGRGKPAALVTEAKSFIAGHKLFMAHMARHCGVLETGMPLDSTGKVDPIRLAFEQGKRDAFLHMLQLGEMSSEDYDELLSDLNDEMREGDMA